MPARGRRNRNSRPRKAKKKAKARSTQPVHPPIPTTQMPKSNPSQQNSKFQSSFHRIQDTIYDIFHASKSHFLWTPIVQVGISKMFPTFGIGGRKWNHLLKTSHGYLRLYEYNPLLLVFYPTKQFMCPLGRKKCKDMSCPDPCPRLFFESFL